MASQSILGKESTVDLLSSGILQTLVDLNFMILEFFFQMCKHSTKLFRSEDSSKTSKLQQQQLEVNVSIWDHGISPWRSTWDLLPQLQRLGELVAQLIHL